MDIAEIAKNVVVLTSPFMPLLLEIIKNGTTEFTKHIASNGGDAAWKVAQQLWNRITKNTEQESTVQDAAKLVAKKPNFAIYQQSLISALEMELQQNQELVQQLETDLKTTHIQEMIAIRDGRIVGGRQSASGPGTSTQRMRASNGGVIENSEQITGMPEEKKNKPDKSS